ncbi:MAG: dihydroorotase, partial [Candidatus Hydrogenedentes bacterium]|nr:dihydroorotase [Candidatus Hydrogenedentota bacterium]
MSLVIKNGHVIEPAQGISEVMDVLIEEGRIKRVGKGLSGDESIDATGLVVCPGLVDIHVHFREPGFESKETIETGARAGAAGGFTTVVTMANTEPRIDNAGMVEFVARRAREAAVIKIRPAACATKGMLGQEITEMAELKDVGAVAVTDDGKDIASSAVLRRVLEYARMVGLPYMAHCEDEALAEGGAMNEGFTATLLGIPGIPKAAEECRIDRNIRLAELAGAHIHIQHVTSAGGVEIVRQAKKRGARVTCESAPHYWMLTDEAIKTFNANAKMNPPLREEEDRLAIIEGFKDGTIDCIATDHAPHTPTEKEVEFSVAPFGILGLETSLALAITGLVEPGHLALERVIALMTVEGSKLCNLGVGTLAEGSAADVCVFDPKA